MEVTIIGGGVSGLALAHELAPDHDVTVLEASPGPRGGGYMIDFFGPGFLAAERMGILEELRSRGNVFDGVRFARPDGTPSGTIDVGPLVEAAGGRYFSILRPEVELGLLAQLPASVDVRYGQRAVAVRDAALSGAMDPARAVVETADGATLESDLVVACDGVRSPFREHVAPGHGEIVPMGYRAASYLLEAPELADELGNHALMTDTIQRIGGMYAAGAGRIGVLCAQRVDRRLTERPEPDPSRLRAEFSGLHPLVDTALEQAPASFYDDLVAQSAAPTWSRGRVVLAGDAAHAVSLLAGQGTSLAVAGAEALARSLRAAGPHVEVGLRDYERRWRPVVERAQRAGRRSAASFIPANGVQLRVQQVARRTLSIPGVSRLLAPQFIGA
ncbi:FAD-dependent monooxygenase [Brachybacterium sp. GCM10030267]|uniref:FAD-dependent monooxygenase n=1 Tax=Brachybacterium sp. GCM10030267 TaxID=3273381 RepID=UPI00361CE019